MRMLARLTPIFSLLLAVSSANAVPSFARQTGLSCNVCHSNPPELTAFGRSFKLKGYVLADMTAEQRVGNNKDLLLSKYIPLSAMILLSNTMFQSNQPGTQNNAAGFPQQLSIFLAGGFASHFGGLSQFTYTHASNHFGMDNTDLRYGNQAKLGNKDWSYGLTLNNNPGVEDLWNSTPVWGFPWNQTGSGVSPMASPLINGALGSDVAGIGAYSMWNNHLYTDISLYRSEHAGFASPISGTGQAHNISGVAPYWRAAWQQNWGNNYLMVGTYGIYANSYPGAISGPENRYLDPAFDFQYERPLGSNLLDAHGTYIHEKANLGATFAAGGALSKNASLNTFRFDSTYHWRNKYSATGGAFSTTGAGDTVLYAVAPLIGSNNGRPDTSGYIAQFGYWPVQNIDINVNYTGYLKFNGAANNYDGGHRNAADNNTVYISLWLNF